MRCTLCNREQYRGTVSKAVTSDTSFPNGYWFLFRLFTLSPVPWLMVGKRQHRWPECLSLFHLITYRRHSVPSPINGRRQEGCAVFRAGIVVSGHIDPWGVCIPYQGAWVSVLALLLTSFLLRHSPGAHRRWLQHLGSCHPCVGLGPTSQLRSYLAVPPWWASEE